MSKLAAEQHLRAAAEYFGLEYIILRLHSTYGPNMDFEASRSSLIARAVASVRLAPRHRRSTHRVQPLVYPPSKLPEYGT